MSDEKPPVKKNVQWQLLVIKTNSLKKLINFQNKVSSLISYSTAVMCKISDNS